MHLIELPVHSSHQAKIPNGQGAMIRTMLLWAQALEVGCHQTGVLDMRLAEGAGGGEGGVPLVKAGSVCGKP